MGKPRATAKSYLRLKGNAEFNMRAIVSTQAKAGSCNFCTENIGPNGSIDPEMTMYRISGLNIEIRICPDCLRSLMFLLDGWPRKRGQKCHAHISS